MTKGILYGIGVGPGDPELLTLKAVRLMREADVIAVPDKGSGKKTALNIVAEHVEGKELMFCPTPMVREASILNAAYDDIADRLAMLLDEGKNIVFITLGDPTVYSTYVYIHQRILARGYEAQLIPGVTSFCAVAARLNIPLCERSERLMIVPASHKDIDDCLAVDANYVFMKAGSEINALKDKLTEHGIIDGASMIENCGMEGERVFKNFADMPEGSGYFSVVIAKNKEQN